MNLVGKIFTVLIFLMSVVFSTFALAVYSTHKNWRSVVDNATAPLGLYQQLENARKENTALVEKKKALEDERQIEKTRYDKTIVKLEAENVNLRKERDANELKVSELNEALLKAVAAVKAAHETLAVLRTQVDTMRADIKTAQADRDAAFKKVVELTDKLNIAVAERLRLEKASTELQNQLVKARECLQWNKLNEKSDYKAKSPPVELLGEVTGVPQPDLVEISVGADDGVRKGHKFEVVRMGGGVTKYVGRIEVMQTFPERAVCRVDSKMQKSQIQKGDRAYANLSEVK
jgi:hypothetical protein